MHVWIWQLVCLVLFPNASTWLFLIETKVEKDVQVMHALIWKLVCRRHPSFVSKMPQLDYF